MKSFDLTAERARELWGYDPESGVFTWKYREGAATSWNARFADKRAGGPTSNGDWQIRVGPKIYLGHRLAWLIVHGEWPQRAINRRNMEPRKNNSSGFKGVSGGCKPGRWVSQITVGGNHRHIGTFDSPEAAHAAYCREVAELHSEFARAG